MCMVASIDGSVNEEANAEWYVAWFGESGNEYKMARINIEAVFLWVDWT